MPSGYTCGVQEGKITEVKEYILSCAKNFGAFMHMRDNGLDSKIQYREPSDYHLKRLEESQEEYSKFLKLTDEEIQVDLDRSYEQGIKDRQKGLKKFEEGKQRYLDMLEKVREWESPTEEHNNLKKFAIEQLENSLDFDYSDNLKKYYEETPPRETVEEYKKRKIQKCLKDIEYHSKNYREELENADGVNQWIKDLVESFE